LRAVDGYYIAISRALTDANGPFSFTSTSTSSSLWLPGFVRTPLVEKQIPEQAIKLGISEARS